MKTACIVKIDGEAEPTKLQTELTTAGYEVVVLSIDKSKFEELRQCDPNEFPDNFKEKLGTASLIIFYLTESLCEADDFGALGVVALGGNADVIGVWPEGSTATEAPKSLDDLGASLIAESSEKLPRVICGDEDAWELPDSKPAQTSKREHQAKC